MSKLLIFYIYLLNYQNTVNYMGNLSILLLKSNFNHKLAIGT